MFEGRLEEFVDLDRGRRRCQICGRRLLLLYGGKIRTHTTGASNCAGSRELPWHESDAKIESELRYYAEQVEADDRRADRIRLGTDNEPPTPYFESHSRFHRERRDYLARRLARSRRLDWSSKW